MILRACCSFHLIRKNIFKLWFRHTKKNLLNEIIDITLWGNMSSCWYLVTTKFVTKFMEKNLCFFLINEYVYIFGCTAIWTDTFVVFYTTIRLTSQTHPSFVTGSWRFYDFLKFKEGNQNVIHCMPVQKSTTSHSSNNYVLLLAQGTVYLWRLNKKGKILHDTWPCGTVLTSKVKY